MSRKNEAKFLTLEFEFQWFLKEVFYVVFGCKLFVKTGEKEIVAGVWGEWEGEENTLNLRSHRWCTSGTGAR